MRDKRKKEENTIPSKIVESINSLSPEYLLRCESSPAYPIETFDISEKLDSSKKIKKIEKEYNIGNYLIKKTLGQGTFGKVKLGIYLPTGEKVAIKILEKDRIVELDDKVRVKREFDMLARLNHPNVILVAEIFESQNNYYSVMEYCEGGELFNYIVKNRRIGNNESAFFYYQLINGLEYIHSLGIVHRDLKPENLLLTKEHILKIIDFGLSNYFKEGQKDYLSTPCGSPCYASPEMVSGKKYNGFKIDIWSTGIILYAMLCGYLPFEDKDNDILFEKILECKLIFPRYIKKDAKDLIEKILVTDPEKRINISEIKNHPFYLKGKEIFDQEFSVLKVDNIDANSEKKSIQLNEIELIMDNGRQKQNEKENKNILNIEKDKNKEKTKNIKIEKSLKNKKESKNKIISLHIDLDQDNNKKHINCEGKENNKNLGMEIINSSEKENKEIKKRKFSKKKEKEISENNNDKEGNDKNNINKKNHYVKNKELPLKLGNHGEIKKKVAKNGNKINQRIKSRENKSIKKQIKTTNYNKFKNYLNKKIQIDIDISPKLKSNINNKEIITRKTHFTNITQNKYNSKIGSKQNQIMYLDNINLSNINNTIDNERVPNKIKNSFNLQKIASNSNKSTKKANSGKKQLKLESFEKDNNTFIDSLFKINNNLKKFEHKGNLYNLKNNNNHNSEFKNNIKEINIYFNNNENKYKNKKEENIYFNSNMKENIAKIEPKKEIRNHHKIIKTKIPNIQIDIFDTNLDNQINYKEKKLEDNIIPKITITNKNQGKISLGKSQEITKLEKKDKLIINNLNKKTFDKTKDLNSKKSIDVENNKYQFNIDISNNIGYLPTQDHINKSDHLTRQKINKKINNNKAEILEKKVNIPINKIKVKDIRISNHNSNLNTIENICKTEYKKKNIGTMKKNINDLINNKEEKKSIIHIKLNSINANKITNNKNPKNIFHPSKKQSNTLSNQSKNLNKTENNPFLNESNNYETINYTLNYFNQNNSSAISTLNKKYKKSQIISKTLKRKKPYITIRNTVANINMLDTGLFLAALEKKKDFKFKNNNIEQNSPVSRIHNNRLYGLCSKFYNSNYSYSISNNMKTANSNTFNFKTINDINYQKLKSKKIIGYKESYKIKKIKKLNNQDKGHMKYNSMKYGYLNSRGSKKEAKNANIITLLSNSINDNKIDNGQHERLNTIGNEALSSTIDKNKKTIIMHK